jgi:hypothetical protein
MFFLSYFSYYSPLDIVGSNKTFKEDIRRKNEKILR